MSDPKAPKAAPSGDTSEADRRARLARLAERKDVEHPVTSSKRPPRDLPGPDPERVAARAARAKGGK